MKFKFLTVFIFTFFASITAAQAVEQMALEPAMSSADVYSAESLPLIVSGNEELILKAGTVFSEKARPEGMELPYLISNPAPIKYPRWALRQGWQGDISIAVEITPEGNVGRTKVMKSTGYSVLDEAATKAVHTWKFHPAMKNGQAVVTCIQIPVRFQIKNQE